LAKGRAFAKPLAVKRTEFAGVLYDSKAEAQRAAALAQLRDAGLVKAVFRQVKADVGEAGIDKPYRIDFLVIALDAEGGIEAWAEDVKGADSPTFRRHVKQWERRGGIPLRVYRRGKLAETIPGGRRYHEPVWNGTVVDGIDYGSKYRAQIAEGLSQRRIYGSVAAWFRGVATGVEALPQAAFLVIPSGDPMAAIVTEYGEPEAWIATPGGVLPSSAVDAWRASGPVTLCVHDSTAHNVRWRVRPESWK